jgi:gliding motility-associated-like protein
MTPYHPSNQRSNKDVTQTQNSERIAGTSTVLKIISSMVLLFTCSFLLAQAPVFSVNDTQGCTPMGVIITVTSPSAGSISSYAWTITYPDNSTVTASSSQYIAIFSQPGSYDVSLTINGNQTTSIPDYITVYPVPQASFSVDDQEGCWPFCVQFSDVTILGGGDIVEWSWDFGNGSTSTEQNPQYCYNQVGTYSPVFSVEDEFGCFSDITIPGLIHVESTFPNAAFAISNELDCMPPVLEELTNNSTGISALTSTWDFGDGQTATLSGADDTQHTWNNIGTYNVCLTVEDEIGCVDTQCQELVIFDTAEALFTVSEIQVCENEAVAFTNTTTPTPIEFQWDFNNDGTIDSYAQNPNYAFSQDGNYNPSLNVIYSNTCFDETDGLYNIQVIDGIIASFSGDTLESCQVPFDVELTASASGPGTLTYAWTISGQPVNNSDQFTYSFQNFGNYSVGLNVSNEFGCNTVVSLNNYIQIQEPDVSFVQPASVCTNSPFSLLSISSTSIDPIALWEWDFNNDGIIDSTDPDPVITYSAPGNYTISVAITTQHGCESSFVSPATLVVQEQVDTGFTSNTQISCAGEAVEFCVDQQPGVTYSWNFGDSGWQTFNNFNTCVTHDYIDTGYFDVGLSVFNSGCFLQVIYEDFIYIAPPLAMYEFELDCSDLLGVQFHDTSIGADSLVWDFGDGNIDSSNNPNPFHQYATGGVYNVVLTAYADVGDCPDTREFEINLFPPDPSLIISPNAGCPPLLVNVQDVGENWTWDIQISNGYHINVFWDDLPNLWNMTYEHDGITESETFGINEDFLPDILFGVAGSYDFQVTVTDQNLCQADTLYDNAVVVAANPDFASFDVVQEEICDSVYISFSPNLQDLVSWEWEFSDGTIVTEENPGHTFEQPYPYGNPLTATLTAVDATGCVSTVTQNIALEYPPTPGFIVVVDPSCIGDDVQFLNMTEDSDAGYTYDWTFGDPSSGVNNTSTLEDPVHVYSSNGTYEVCLTAHAPNGCSVTYCNADAVHVTDPIAEFTYTSNINNCLFGVTFENTTAGNIVYTEWDFGDNQIGLGENPYHTYPIGVYDVSLVVVNENGCVDTLLVPDILNYGDVIGPFTQVLDTANCTPFTVDFSSFNISDTSFDYFWDFNDGNGDPSSVTQTTHDYTAAGSYCPSLIMTDGNGCPVLISCPDTIDVIDFSLAFSSIDPICYGDSLHFSVSGGTSYIWQDTEFVTETGPGEYELHPPSNYTYTITGYYSDCVTTQEINLTVNPLPIVVVDDVTEVCYQDPVFILDGGEPVEGAGQYFIEGVPSTTFNPSQPPDELYEIVYVFTDENNCTNSDTTSIFINPLPNVTMFPFDPVCEDAPDINLGNGNPVGGAYVFQLDTITSFSPSNGYGNYNISYFFTDQNGCTNFDSENLIVHPLPLPQLVIADICLNESLVINNTSTIPQGTVSSAIWDFGPIGTQNSIQPNPVVYPAIGNYPISLQLSSAAGCTASLDTTVNVWSVPNAEFIVPEGCQYSDLLFVNQSTIDVGTIDFLHWQAEGNTINSSDSLYYSFQGWGSVDMSLIPESNHGCTDTVTYAVTVHPAPIVGLSTENVCFGDMAEFIAQSSIPQGVVMQESWDPGDGSPSVSGNAVDHYYYLPDTYGPMFSASSDFGCVTSLVDSIVIYPLAYPNFQTEGPAFCAFTPFQFSDLSVVNSPYEVVEWAWFLEDSLFSEEQNPFVYFSDPGIYNLTFQVTTNMGCESDSLLPNAITIWPKPHAEFVPNPNETFIYDPIVEFEDLSSEDVVVWGWNLGDGTISSEQNPVHEYQTWDTYYITQYVENQYGCRDTAWHDVVVNPDMLIYVPNAFTPDLDGINEYFKPVMSGFDVDLYEFSVFDRWGEVIFITEDPDVGWNAGAKESGYFVPDGVYQWQLKVRAEHNVTIRFMQGHVTVLR